MSFEIMMRRVGRDVGLLREVAARFRVAESVVWAWVDGAALPLESIQLQVVEFVSQVGGGGRPPLVHAPRTA